MRRRISLRKDHAGALLLIALGAAVLAMGLAYRMGSLSNMGAGFTPVVLGALLVLVGIAIGATTPIGTPESASVAPAVHDPGGPAEPARRPEWRGWLCILGGVIAFVLLGEHGGLVPATFASVFIAAMGDRQNTWRGAALLSLVMVAFGVATFHYGLKLQLPLFAWQ